MLKTFNYIGSKLKLLDFLKENIEEYTHKKISDIKSFGDLFSGTGVVGYFFAKRGCLNIVSNDIQHYGYVVSSIITTNGINIIKLTDILNDINNMLTDIKDTSLANNSHFIYNTYTEACIEEQRMYLTKLNGLKTDIARQYIEQLFNNHSLTNEEYRCLIKILLYAVTKVSNVASVYAAYLKQYKKPSLKELFLDAQILHNLLVSDTIVHKSYNNDIRDFVSNMQFTEVVYLDPPYNNRRYDQNFHLLETISKYDYPIVKGKTGQRVNENSGAKMFCSKTNINKEFTNLVDKLNAKYLFISYNSEGLLSKNDIISILSNRWTDIDCIEKQYIRFKSNTNNEEQQQKYITEYLFRAKKINL
jgi:adenine-specific DNA-methyltransferase